MGDLKTNLGTVVKSARKNKKLTQMELSEELGITPRYLQAIENENKTPSYSLLLHILSYLDIPADRVFAPHECLLSPELEQLLYFIHYKCNQREISVLLSTAKALVNTREEEN
ncbi:XRE family transcriptional regulator [bacterium 1XD42-8]|jgi:transcriptional regulator with XRE-family HTH domain|nr:helix-turn-helix transcriptional regulator [Lachnospiraceae bacterium]RKJ34879.1 XRE family transcriptional regulator [bacterium 1XD42-8]